MPLTDYGVKFLGFEPLPTGAVLSAAFYSAQVYQIKGMTLDESALPPSAGTVGTAGYRLSAGSSVNAIFQALLSDDFVDDEDSWKDKGKHSPPYLVILIGPTDVLTVEQPRIKRVGGDIISYDAFRGVKRQLQDWREAILPRLSTALACHFSYPDLEVRFDKIAEATFGVTNDNETVHDVRMDFNARLSTSRKFDAIDVARNLNDAIEMAEMMNQRVSQFYYLALSEKDDLKRFLFFFLALEFFTNRTYKPLRAAGRLIQPPVVPEKLRTAAAALFERAPDNMKSLRDHFVWSALYEWDHVGDDEVREFVRLKKIRDDIAHGDIEGPNHADVRAIEKFVTTLLLPK